MSSLLGPLGGFSWPLLWHGALEECISFSCFGFVVLVEISHLWDHAVVCVKENFTFIGTANWSTLQMRLCSHEL